MSKPSFDPDQLAGHDVKAVRAARARLLDDPDEPLDNRAIAGDQYPPGSVFKLVTAAAALESGRWTKDSQVSGPASLDLPQTTATLPNDFAGAVRPERQGQPRRRAADLLQHRLRVTRAGPRRRRAAGAGGEVRLRREPADPAAGDAEHASPPRLNPPQTAQSAIGQFDVRVTPMQMAMVTAAIANGGVADAAQPGREGPRPGRPRGDRAARAAASSGGRSAGAPPSS